MAAVQAAVQHVAVLEEEHELDQLINEIDITKLVNINKIYTYDDVGIQIMEYALELCTQRLHRDQMKASRINASSMTHFISTGFENDPFTKMFDWNDKHKPRVITKPDGVFLLEWTDAQFSAQKAHIYYEADADATKKSVIEKEKHSIKIYQSICGCRMINEDVPAIIVRANLFRGPEIYAEHISKYTDKIRKIIRDHMKPHSTDDTDESESEDDDPHQPDARHAAISGLLVKNEVQSVVSGTKLERAISFLHLLCVAHVWTCWQITQLVQKKGNLRDIGYVTGQPRDLYFFVGAFDVPQHSVSDTFKTTLHKYNVKRGLPVQVVTIKRYEGVEQLMLAIKTQGLTKGKIEPPKGLVTIQDLWKIAAQLKLEKKTWSEVMAVTGNVAVTEYNKYFVSPSDIAKAVVGTIPQKK